jgi:hypothetical protein
MHSAVKTCAIAGMACRPNLFDLKQKSITVAIERD